LTRAGKESNQRANIFGLPSYRWTYRAKLLKSDFGGAPRLYRELADAAWM
jgi:hypothetical protein